MQMKPVLQTQERRVRRERKERKTLEQPEQKGKRSEVNGAAAQRKRAEIVEEKAGETTHMYPRGCCRCLIWTLGT